MTRRSEGVGAGPLLLRAARGRCRTRAGGAGGAPALPAALRPPLLPSRLLAMAAEASLSPEELLPKGGAGKAEELEDELEEEEEDDEEVAGKGRRGKGGRAGAVTPPGSAGPVKRGLTRLVPPAAGRDAGGAAVGAHGDVPRERAIGGRRYVRPVADGSAEDVQVRGRRARAGAPSERARRAERGLWALAAECGDCGERQSHGARLRAGIMGQPRVNRGWIWR